MKQKIKQIVGRVALAARKLVGRRKKVYWNDLTIYWDETGGAINGGEEDET